MTKHCKGYLQLHKHIEHAWKAKKGKKQILPDNRESDLETTTFFLNK